MRKFSESVGRLLIFSDFVDSVKKLLKRMIKQGAKPPSNVGREGGGKEVNFTQNDGKALV